MRPCPPIQDALRRGNPPLSPHRTPPRPSGDPRKHAGTLSRRPPYSNFARMCKVATKSDFFSSTGRGAFSFCQEQKENGGRIPRGNGPLAGARFLRPMGRTPILPPTLLTPPPARRAPG